MRALGGAIALVVHLKEPNIVRVIFVEQK